MAPAASLASSSGAGAIVALAASGATRAKRVSAEIDELLQAQKSAREEKNILSAAVKNARRRRSRLTKRARLLSTEDLLTVVALREAERVARSLDPTPADSAEAAEVELRDGGTGDDRREAAPSDDDAAGESEDRDDGEIH